MNIYIMEKWVFCDPCTKYPSRTCYKLYAAAPENIKTTDDVPIFQTLESLLDAITPFSNRHHFILGRHPNVPAKKSLPKGTEIYKALTHPVDLRKLAQSKLSYEYRRD